MLYMVEFMIRKCADSVQSAYMHVHACFHVKIVSSLGAAHNYCVDTAFYSLYISSLNSAAGTSQVLPSLYPKSEDTRESCVTRNRSD